VLKAGIPHRAGLRRQRRRKKRKARDRRNRNRGKRARRKTIIERLEKRKEVRIVGHSTSKPKTIEIKESTKIRDAKITKN
jgi:hypothetical protein